MFVLMDELLVVVLVGTEVEVNGLAVVEADGAFDVVPTLKEVVVLLLHLTPVVEAHTALV